jgi:hypothetical protein
MPGTVSPPSGAGPPPTAPGWTAEESKPPATAPAAAQPGAPPTRARSGSDPKRSTTKSTISTTATPPWRANCCSGTGTSPTQPASLRRERAPTRESLVADPVGRRLRLVTLAADAEASLLHAEVCWAPRVQMSSQSSTAGDHQSSAARLTLSPRTRPKCSSTGTAHLVVTVTTASGWASSRTSSRRLGRPEVMQWVHGITDHPTWGRPTRNGFVLYGAFNGVEGAAYVRREHGNRWSISTAHPQRAVDWNR